MRGLVLTCFVLALLLPSAIAFNCNSLSGGDLQICNSIQNTNLSQTDKDLLIGDIFNKNKTTPNFDFIYTWNSNLNIQSPSDSRYYSSGTIHNAWIDIVVLMPSIIENNTLYAPNNGKLQTAYDFQYGSLPSGTEYRDCRTDYSWSSQTANLNVYLNGNIIGTSKISSYQAYNTENLDLKSELTIVAKYKVVHYRYKYVNNRQVCRSSSTEYRTDSLKISDTLNAKLFKSQLANSFKITNQHFNVTRGVLTANNFTNLVLSFNNSEYRDSKYIYSLNYSLPYYVLTLRADKIENTKQNNIFVEKSGNSFLFTVKDSSNCKIQLQDHFNKISQNCDMSFNETNFSIKTDKTNYYENDTIKVYITPSNVVVNITYANQTIIAKNYTEIQAVLYENKIKAKLNDKEINRLVNITKQSDIELFWNFSILTFFSWFFFKIGKIYYKPLT